MVAAVAVGIVLVTVAVALLRMQEATAVANLDEVLSDEAEAIGFAITEDREIPVLFDDDRVMVARSPSGEIIAFEGTADELADTDIDPGDDRGVTMTFDGEPHRVVAEQFVTADGVGVVLLGEPRDELDDSVTDLGRALRWVIPVALVTLTGLIWWLVGLALRPVESMRREVAGLGIRQLDHRVDVPRGGDEVTRLALTLNLMLSRLEVAVRRQQRFVADASHELRTPLARMRAEAEADALDPAADAERTRQSELEELSALQGMVDDMLLLARADADMTGIRRVPVDLDDLVLDEVRAVRATTTKTVDASAVSAAQVEGAGAELTRVVRNLLDNARRYADTTITVALVEDDNGATLTVDDDGPGIPDERRDEVFERFRRLDVSRHTVGGAGLGLSIVAEIVARHDGTVRIDDSPLGGARFVVWLPTSSATVAAI